jgi:hypothetical protein
LQKVVIVHELHEGPNRELVKQLIRGGVPDGSANWLGVFVNVMVREGGEKRGRTSRKSFENCSE